MDSLSFDIETIPQRAPFSIIQEEEFSRKLETYLSKRSEEDVEEAQRLLMGTSPYYGEIICIGLGYENGDGEFKTRSLIGEEPLILTNFWNLISKFTGTFVSYNGLEFDVPFILARSMKHNIKVTNKNFIDTRRFQKYPHFDVKQVMSDWDRFRSCTLRLACDHLGIPSPKENDIKAKDVAKAFAEGRIEEIQEYCLRDVKATLQIFKIVKNYTIIK